MKVSDNDLMRKYSSLADKELLELYLDGGLAQEALPILQNEMNKRGLTIDRDKLKEIKREMDLGQEIRIDQAKLQQLIYEYEGNQNLTLAIAGGAIASCISAALWAIVTFRSGYQLGFTAIAVGAVVAFVVRKSGKGLTKIFGFVGAIFSVLGCLVGNLLGYCVIIAKENAIPFILFIRRIESQIVFEIMKQTFSIGDLLFYGIAAYIGYKYSFRSLTEDEMERIMQK